MHERELYNPAWTTEYYNEYADKEWDRFVGRAANRVNLYLHTHYLQRFIERDARVLEVGAGPGRFTQVLAALGCRVVVVDISPVQLELHQKYAQELGFDGAVESRQCMDVCDLSGLPSDSFDAVLCYGGPLSYVFDRAPVALAECVRACKPQGRVLASVMSLWGTCHRYLTDVLGTIPPANNRLITDTGDLLPSNWDGVTHRCHMFRAAEFRQLAEDTSLGILAISAANCLSLTWDEELAAFHEDSAEWQEVLRMELEACAQDGCLDMGTHIILVGEKLSRSAESS